MLSLHFVLKEKKKHILLDSVETNLNIWRVWWPSPRQVRVQIPTSPRQVRDDRKTSRVRTRVRDRTRVLQPYVLPHLKTGYTISALNRSLQRVKWIWGPLLTLRKLRERGTEARGLRPFRTSPLEVEWLTPNFTVPVSLRCPQGTGLPTLPPRVLQGVTVSGERIS